MKNLPSWLTEEQKEAMTKAHEWSKLAEVFPTPDAEWAEAHKMFGVLAALVRSLIEKGEEKDRALEEARRYLVNRGKHELADRLARALASLPDAKEPCLTHPCKHCGECARCKTMKCFPPDAKEPCHDSCSECRLIGCTGRNCGCQPSGDERKEARP